MEESNAKKKKSIPRRVLKIILILILIIILAAVALVAFLTFTEYDPDEEETVIPSSTMQKATLKLAVERGKLLTAVTWNVGYCALDDTADFFMDGGTKVKTADKSQIEKNQKDIIKTINSMKPDFVMLQEVDSDSDRSENIDQVKEFSDRIGEGESQSTFAYNYKVKFVPYPIPPLGKTNSGIQTISFYETDGARRIQLPVPFKWPVRIANLKRCLLIDYFDVAGSDKKLAVINLHLEAYDSGKGKVAQTKKLKKILDEERKAGNYVIAGGDFNQVFSGVDMSKYPEQKDKWMPGRINEKVFSKGWQFRMDPSVPTCRSLDQSYKESDKDSFQYYMIDGYIVSDNIAVDSVKTQDLEFRNSDHNPVVLRFALK